MKLTPAELEILNMPVDGSLGLPQWLLWLVCGAGIIQLAMAIGVVVALAKSDLNESSSVWLGLTIMALAFFMMPRCASSLF